MGRMQKLASATLAKGKRASPALAAYELIMFSAAILAIVLMPN